MDVRLTTSSSRQSPRPFRFGVQLRGSDLAGTIEAARKAESLGYAVATIPDHVTEQLAPIPALAAVALATRSLRIGTMVMSNDWRNPVLVAREAATLDRISNGRLELGIGAGWEPTDYGRLGISYDPAATRVRRLREALEIVKDLLSGATVTRAGAYYQLTEATCHPLPVQKPHPPLLVGGGARRVLTLAGRLADIVNVHADLGQGRPGTANPPDARAESAKQRVGWVRDGAGPRLARIELGFRVFMAALTDQRATVAAGLGSAWKLSAEQVLASPNALVGSVGSVVEDLLARRESLGASYYVWDVSAMETMAPVVRALAGR